MRGASKVLAWDRRKPAVVLGTADGSPFFATAAGADDDVNAIAVNGNGRLVALADDAGRVSVLENATARPFKKMRGQHANVRRCHALVSYRAAAEPVRGGSRAPVTDLPDGDLPPQASLRRCACTAALPPCAGH